MRNRGAKSLVGLTRREALLAAVAAPAMAGNLGAWPIGPDLRAAARVSNRFFGAAVQADQLRHDAPFREAVMGQCDCLTPELELKWAAVQPVAARFDFARMDALAGFARHHGKRLHGHTLLWHRSIPGWARAAIAETRDWAIIHRFFAAVIARYDGIVDYWDVVNEPIEIGDSPTHLRRSPFLDAFGLDYVRRALDSARALSPKGRLLINEYGIEYADLASESRRGALLALIDRLRQQGVPLDGIGIQAHLDLQKGQLDQAVFARFLQDLADRNLLVLITELDVREADPRLPWAERDEQVAGAVRAFLDVALDQAAVRGVTTWGFSDRYSWLNDDGRGVMQPGRNRGLPFDAALRPKPFVQAIATALRRVPYIVPPPVEIVPLQVDSMFDTTPPP